MNRLEAQEERGPQRLSPSDQRPEGAPARYTLNYPSTWSNLDLDPNTRDASIKRAVEAQAKGAKAEREVVDSLIRELRRSAREAYAQGALQLGNMLVFLPDGSTLVATSMVLRTRIPDGETADLAEIMLAAGVQNNRTTAGRGTGLNRVEIMELPEVGSVGRMTSLEDIDYSGRGTVRTAVHKVVIPVPSSRDLMLLVGSTPNLTLAEKFFDVFDSVAGTFRFHDSEEPEPLETEPQETRSAGDTGHLPDTGDAPDTGNTADATTENGK